MSRASFDLVYLGVGKLTGIPMMSLPRGSAVAPCGELCVAAASLRRGVDDVDHDDDEDNEEDYDDGGDGDDGDGSDVDDDDGSEDEVARQGSVGGLT